LAIIESDHVAELITGFGERGLLAEQVAAQVADETRRYLAGQVPVGEHLADQLLLPMALGSGGDFRTVKPSLHCTTQLRLLADVLGVRATAVEERDDVWRIEVEAASSSAALG
jgi:RNA 3'-terminal phosphate cyclase (ATP)